MALFVWKRTASNRARLQHHNLPTGGTSSHPFKHHHETHPELEGSGYAT